MAFFSWALDGLVTEPEAKRTLAPFVDLLTTSFYGAWNEWLALPAESRSKIGPMHRGGVIHAFVVKRAIDAVIALNDSSVELCTRGFFKIYFRRSVVVRLKKLGTDGRVPINGTRKATRLYYSGAKMKTVRSSCTRLSVGYRLDPTETEIRDIRIVHQIRDEIAWSYAINDADHASEFRFPIEDAQPVPPPTRVKLIDGLSSEAAGG
jgi:hypothetical protein